MSEIRWLGDDDCHRAASFGGKAASLSRLASRHTVPHGFAISALPATTTALPDGLAAAVRQAYRALGERCGAAEPSVAVRSSGIDEDGVEASFAGQHDTYLNIRGADAVIDSVMRCAGSALSAEALSYRERRGLPQDDVHIAVLVQQLVCSDVSAVAFSANPLTGSRDEVMINASWGLGESIVGGSVTPDMFVVAKRGFAVSQREIARKRRMTVLTDRATAEVEVPRALQEKPSLSDAEIRVIAELAVTLELAVGHAVDIECAIAKDLLYLLQCRAITTLA